MKFNIAFLPGDGVGPELAKVTQRCIDATGADISWDVQLAGVDVMETEKTPLPQPGWMSKEIITNRDRKGGDAAWVVFQIFHQSNGSFGIQMGTLADLGGCMMMIDAPHMKKIRIIIPLVAPIVRRIAMSFPLSLTSIISPEIMLNAATIMISVRIRNITLRST